MRLAAGELPYQPAVNRAEEQLALLRFCARPFDMVENPFDLGAGKIRVNQKTRFFLELIHETLAFQILAYLGCLPRLPYDGVIHRAACRLVPHHGCLALICDADCRYVACDELCLFQSFLHHLHHRAPNFLGVVLHPARLGEMLRELLLRHAHDMRVVIEDDCPVAGSPRVERHNVLCHLYCPLQMYFVCKASLIIVSCIKIINREKDFLRRHKTSLILFDGS